MPTLFCRKKTGPFESSLIAAASIKKTGESTSSPKHDANSSKIRFTYRYIEPPMLSQPV